MSDFRFNFLAGIILGLCFCISGCSNAKKPERTLTPPVKEIGTVHQYNEIGLRVELRPKNSKSFMSGPIAVEIAYRNRSTSAIELVFRFLRAGELCVLSVKEQGECRVDFKPNKEDPYCCYLYRLEPGCSLVHTCHLNPCVTVKNPGRFLAEYELTFEVDRMYDKKGVIPMVFHGALEFEATAGSEAELKNEIAELGGCLDVNDAEKRMDAYDGLTHLKTPLVIDYLKRMVTMNLEDSREAKDEHSNVRFRLGALSALGHIPVKEIDDVFLSVLKMPNPDSDMVGTALVQLGERGTPVPSEILARLLESRGSRRGHEFMYSASAMNYLSRWAKPEHRKLLETLAHDDNDRNRGFASRARQIIMRMDFENRMSEMHSRGNRPQTQ